MVKGMTGDTWKCICVCISCYHQTAGKLYEDVHGEGYSGSRECHKPVAQQLYAYKWATFGMPCNLSKEHKVLQEILNHNAIYMRDVQRSWNCPGKPGLFRLDCDRKITRRPVIYTTVEGFWLIKFVKGLELETRWWQSMGLQWRASGSQLLPSSSSAVRIPLRWVSHNLMDLLENSELLCWKFHFTTNKNFTFLFIFSGPVKGYFLSS